MIIPWGVVLNYDICERSLFFSCTVTLSLRLFWGAPDFLGATCFTLFFSLSGLFNSGFFVAGASKTQGFWFFEQVFIIKNRDL